MHERVSSTCQRRKNKSNRINANRLGLAPLRIGLLFSTYSFSLALPITTHSRHLIRHPCRPLSGVIIANIGPVAGIVPILPPLAIANPNATAGDASLLPAVPQVLRAQLLGVSLATFADGRADALLTRASAAQGNQDYQLTFPATGQTLNMNSALASPFIAAGATSAQLQFELLGETPQGNLIARATLVPPIASTNTPGTPPATPSPPDVAQISEAAQQISMLAKLAPTDAAAWISMRPQLAATAHLHNAPSAQAAVLQGLQSLLPALGLGYERALARAALGGADPTAEIFSRFPQSRVIPNRVLVDAPDGSATAALTVGESGIAAWSAQQLLAHEQGTVHWRGTAWPGTAAAIDLGLWREHQPDTEKIHRELRDLLPADARPSAWLRLQISPPTLGPLDIYVAQIPGHGAWARINTERPEALQRMCALQNAFSSVLADARVRVDVRLMSNPSAEAGRPA